MRRRVILGLAVAGAVLAGVVAADTADAAVLRLEAAETAVIRDPRVPSERRVLLGFELPEHLSEGTIDIAMLDLRTSVSTPDTLAGVSLSCFPVTAAWSAETVGWEDGWSNEGGDFDRTRHAAWGAAPGDSVRITFDVTEMVSAWALSEISNHGVIVAVSTGETGTLSCERPSLGSRVKPTLVVWYTPRRDE